MTGNSEITIFSRCRKWFRRFVRLLLWGVALFILILLMAFLFLQTRPGRNLVETGLNRLLDREDFQVVFEGISGTLPFEWNFDRISVLDQDGELLNLEEFRLAWSWSSLLFEHSFRFYEIGADRLTLLRIPETTPPDEETDSDLSIEIPWKWPGPPMRIDRFFVNELKLPLSINDSEVSCSVLAGLRVEESGFTVSGFNVRLLNPGNSPRMEMDAQFDAPANSLQLDLRVYDFHKAPGFPRSDIVKDSTRLLFSGRGDLNDWHGRLRAGDGSGLNLECQVDTFSDNRRKRDILLDGSIEIHPELLQLERWDWLENNRLDFYLDGEFLIAQKQVGGEAEQFSFDLKELNLQIARLNLAARGEFDFKSLFFDGSIKAGFPDFHKMPLLPERVSRMFKGDLELESGIGVDLQRGFYRFDLKTGFRELVFSEPYFEMIIGDNLDLVISFNLDSEMGVHVKAALLEFDKGSLSGSGRIDLSHDQLSGNATLELPELSWLSDPAGRPIEGYGRLTGRVQGSLAGPRVELTLSGEELKINKMGPFSLHAEGETDDLSAAYPEGDLQLDIDWNEDTAGMAVDFKVEQGNLVGNELIVEAFGSRLDGTFELALDSWMVDGKMIFQIPELDKFSKLAGSPAGGSLSGQLDFSSDDKKERQRIQVELNGSDLFFDSWSIDGLEIRGGADDLYTASEMSIEASINNLQKNDLILTDGEAEMAGDIDAFEFAGEFAGRFHEQFNFELHGDYNEVEAERRLDISRFDGVFGELPFRLLQPVTVSYSPERIRLSRIDLDSDFFSFSAEGFKKGNLVEADFQIEKLDLSRLPLEASEWLAGEAELEMSLKGTLDDPILTGRGGFSQMKLPPIEFPQSKYLTGVFEFRSEKNRVEALFALDKEDRELLDCEVSLPLNFSLKPWQLRILEDRPLQGNLRADLELDNIFSVIIPPDQLLEGHFAANLTLNGDLRKPKMEGDINIIDGAYEHFAQGVLLSDIQMAAKVQGNKLLITELKASDKAEGSLKGSGELFLDSESDLNWDARISMTDFIMLRQQLVEVEADNGNFRFRGDSAGAALSGDLVFSRIDARVPEAQAPQLRELEVTEINTESESDEEEDGPPSDEPSKVRADEYPVDLDLDLKLPARGFVRGRGVDSEWRGELRITGRLSKPRIQGVVEPVRGRINLFNREFQLAPESYVRFKGGYPVDPVFDIIGKLGTRDREISLRVSGSAAEPDFELTSKPPMPREEIISWILFGRSVADLTPIQALRLLSAINTLARGDSGMDIFGRLRSLIGIEELELVYDPEGGLSGVGIGRYIHERVYLQLRTGLVPGEEEVSVEVNLSRRLHLESFLGTANKAGIGLFWRYNY